MGFVKYLRWVSQPIFKWAHRRLLEVYCRPGMMNRSFWLRFLQKIRSSAAMWIAGTIFQIQLWEGKSKDLNGTLRVLFIGNQRAISECSPEYLRSLLYGDSPVEKTDLGVCAWLDAQQTSEQLAGMADLVVIERNQSQQWKPRAGYWIQMPVWVRQVFDVAPEQGWENLAQRLRPQKRNIRFIRQNGFTAHVSHADADFELWYERMYVPLIRARHKEYGTVSSRENLRDLFRGGMLLFVMNAEGKPVAGDMLIAQERVLFNVAGGVLDADPYWYAHGVLSALYYFEIEWAFRNGVTLFDSGESRAFTTDGVHQHKRRWGMRSISDWREPNEWLLWAPSGSPLAMRWLEAHPCEAGFSQGNLTDWRAGADWPASALGEGASVSGVDGAEESPTI